MVPLVGTGPKKGTSLFQPHSPGTYPQHQVVGGKVRTTEVLASWEESPLPGSRGERACVLELQPSGLAEEGDVLVQIPQTLPFLTKLSFIFSNGCFFTCCLPLGPFPEASNGWIFESNFHQFSPDRTPKRWGRGGLGEDSETLHAAQFVLPNSTAQLPLRGDFISVAQRPQRCQLNQTSLYSQFPGFLRIVTVSHCSFNLVLLKITLLCTTKMHLEYRILKEDAPRW